MLDENFAALQERRDRSGVLFKGPCCVTVQGWRPHTVAAARRKPSTKYSSKRRGTVLVVEDEVLVRMVIADNLRNAHYTVIEASSADEALALLHNGVDVRLIFSDVQMPGTMDGIALARTVRSEFPLIKIVLTSGHLTRLDWPEYDGFFPKPYDMDQMIKRINTLLD